MAGSLNVMIDTSHYEARVWSPMTKEEVQAYVVLSACAGEIENLPGVSEVHQSREETKISFASEEGIGDFCRFLVQKRIVFMTSSVNFYEDGRY